MEQKVKALEKELELSLQQTEQALQDSQQALQQLEHASSKKMDEMGEMVESLKKKNQQLMNMVLEKEEKDAIKTAVEHTDQESIA